MNFLLRIMYDSVGGRDGGVEAGFVFSRGDVAVRPRPAQVFQWEKTDPIAPTLLVNRIWTAQPNFGDGRKLNRTAQHPWTLLARLIRGIPGRIWKKVWSARPRSIRCLLSPKIRRTIPVPSPRSSTTLSGDGHRTPSSARSWLANVHFYPNALVPSAVNGRVPHCTISLTGRRAAGSSEPQHRPLSRTLPSFFLFSFLVLMLLRWWRHRHRPPQRCGLLVGSLALLLPAFFPALFSPLGRAFPSIFSVSCLLFYFNSYEMAPDF